MKCRKPTVVDWVKGDHFTITHNKERPLENDLDHFMKLQQSGQKHSCVDIGSHWNDKTNLKHPSPSKVKLPRKEIKFIMMIIVITPTAIIALMITDLI